MEQLTDSFELLSEKQHKAIIALIEQPSVTKAAEVAGVGRATLYGWLRGSDFAAAYRDARREALAQATARLQGAASSAVATLESVSGNADAPPSSRVAAASKILDFAYRADRLEEIESLLDELKGYDDDE